MSLVFGSTQTYYGVTTSINLLKNLMKFDATPYFWLCGICAISSKTRFQNDFFGREMNNVQIVESMKICHNTIENRNRLLITHYWMPTMSSISTGAFRGRLDTPTAERECRPFSPKIDKKRSLAPLTT